MERIVNLCAIGIGNRARKYLEYAESHQDKARVCAVVDTDPYRLAEARCRYSLAENQCFADVDDFIRSGIGADGVIVATGDDTHYSISRKILEAGFNLLLEKPMAENIRQCRELVALAERKNAVTAMCYVMRYHPYFSRIREIARSGEFGKITEINHRVNVGIDRMTHTFVRGLWSRKDESSPIFVSKCCHDVDFIFWLAGPEHLSDDLKISSKGSLTKYCQEAAPEHSAGRCVKCPIESECRYSAVDLYLRRKEWIENFEVTKGRTIEDAIGEELRSGRYGRCVYHCDNDVFDWQTASIRTAGGLEIEITMDGIIDKDGRETEIRFENGTLVAKDNVITLKSTDGTVLREEDFRKTCALPLHAGADIDIVEDFCNAVRTGAQTKCSLRDSLPGLEACFEVEAGLC